ncbi:MAG: N-6 DNA methylase, partial [Paludibacter sp.]|nr:N-6 DNA methylase [Paludibacter sp.]
MSLFQKTVVQKYLKQLNPELISAKYLEFKTYFGNTYIQDNIRNSKEEQFQEGFLRELFVNILGYTLNPAPDFNLTTEYKNIKDSKKADGAIIFNNAVKAVIELKGTNTNDLAKIEAQAFGYKNNQHDCVYVITSNFEKLHFYIDNAIEHIEFNLFSLTKPDFENLYLCLSAESIEKGIPKKIKEESLSQEDTITKKLYQDYSLFKRELHQNLVALNPQFDSLTLFKKSQKLLDRFLFLFFAEDRQLLPPNSVRLILNDWRDLQERDVEIPLYDRFKKYFEYLNTGYKGKRYDVFAYNGGLFKPDNVLDAILIDDELLFRHTNKLSEYDFVSEVDVNILGHIFENSLNELDEINAQLAGETIDKTKTKRKKDGVFYTPKYITKYIVENTVGKLCSEKKAELQLIDEEYTTDKKRQLKTKQALLEKLKTYQSWLLQLTICDPACGSGAFLNQALDFLMKEHSYIDELQAKLLGVPMILSDYEKSILENNLFGVDLNEESVEIAKLSLWLRTAQPNRKLNDLNNNIKCGNSLIDDPAVAGNKAFNWHDAFPQVFAKGGFDVVIGNPPYVTRGITDSLKKALNDSFVTAQY